MIKKSFITIILSALCLSFTVGCEDINQETSMSELAASIQKCVDGMNNEVAKKVVDEGVEYYENGRQLYNVEEDGAIVGEAEVQVYPFKVNNLQVDGLVTITDYQPDPESPVINGMLDLHVGAFYRPAINGLLFLGFPIITDFTIEGTIILSGRVDETIEIDIEYNGLTDPKVYRAVINGVDYAEVLQEEIDKAKAEKQQ